MRMFFSLQGRATRSEWWRVDFILGFGAFALAMFEPWLLGVGLAGVCLSVLWVGLIWVGLICVAVRRLHDIGISGWFVLLIKGWFLTCLFTGIVGGLLGLIIANLPAVIVLGMKAGTPGPNKYGERPKVAPEVIPTKANVQPKKIVVHRTTMKIKKKPQAST